MQGYKHGETATPHSIGVLIAGMLFSRNRSSSCRNEARPSAGSPFSALLLHRGCPDVSPDSALPSDTYPPLTPASGKLKLSGGRHRHVSPQLWQSVHLSLSEQKTKRLRQILQPSHPTEPWVGSAGPTPAGILPIPALHPANAAPPRLAAWKSCVCSD